MAVENVGSIAALAAITSPNGQTAFVNNTLVIDQGRDGLFEYLAGDFTTQAASDTQKGIYVPSTVSGFPVTSGCWVRVWDGITGRPEWFGAVPNDATKDCRVAILACGALCAVTALGPKDYYIFAKLVWDRPFRKLRGAMASGSVTSTGNSTKLIATFANDDAVCFGPVSAPAGIAWMPDEIYAEDFDISRNVTRIPPVGGLIENGYAGIRCQYVKRSFVRNVSTREFSVGFVIWRTIYLKVEDCLAYWNSPATTTTNDNLYGFYVRSDSPFGGLPGGNASLYMLNCSAVREGTPGNPDGLGLFMGGTTASSYHGLFVDTFIEGFESANLQKGMGIIGDPGAGLGNGNTDCRIINPVLDACTQVGLNIQYVGGGGSLRIINPYVSAFGIAAGAINVSNLLGPVFIDGGTLLGKFAGSASAGLIIVTCSKLQVRGLGLQDWSRPVEINTMLGSLLDVAMDNSNITSPAGAAVSIAGGSRNKVVVALAGAPGAFATGVNIDTTLTNCLLDVSMIGDGLTTNRLVRGGTAIITQGNVSGHVVLNPGTGAML